MRGEPPTVVVAHVLPLRHVTGTSVVLRALIAEVDRFVGAGPNLSAYLDVSLDSAPAVTLRRLAATRPGGLALLGVNLHVERHLARAIACFSACRQDGVSSFLWVHDYWPHHEPAVRNLVAEHGATLLASTRTVQSALAADGLAADLLQTGLALANLVEPRPHAAGGRFVVGTAGRVVRRKRQIDLAAAFAAARLGPAAELRLRLLPSVVHDVAADEDLLAAMQPAVEAARQAGSRVVVDREPTARPDYQPYSLFVCPSDYEGFSMTPIEATYCGCPAVMSAIPAHREIAEALYPYALDDVLYPPGDVDALAALLRDEARTGRRRAALRERLGDVRATVERRWSMRETARSLLDLVDAAPARPGPVSQPSATSRAAGAARPGTR